MEECEGGKGERGEVERGVEGRGVALTVQKGKSAGGLWKSGKVGDRGQEYRVQRTERETVQKCKSERSSGGKVEK